MRIEKSIEDWCKEHRIIKYEIKDGLVNVKYDVDISDIKLKVIPIKFGIVTGYFVCSSNKLKSLEGCPESVGGYFNCAFNKLVNLKGAPKSVGDGFFCSSNNLTSLEGCPKKVFNCFYCSDNKLTTLNDLKDLPIVLKDTTKEIAQFGYDTFSCDHNPVFSIWHEYNKDNSYGSFRRYIRMTELLS
jgi:hypothetical protein